MNNLLKLSAFLCLFLIASSCTTESLDDSYNEDLTTSNQASASQSCNNQNPQSKLVNNGTVSFTFKIIDSNDNTIQEQNIAPGSTSSWISFNDGQTTFSIESNTTGVSDNKLLLDMPTCSEVEIEVNSSNTIVAPVIQALD